LYRFTGTIFLGTGGLKELVIYPVTLSAKSKPYRGSYVVGAGSKAAYSNFFAFAFLSTVD
jgi:hypothetical protein